MQRVLAASFLAISACSSAGQRQIPDCGRMPDIAHLTTLQRQVLADAINRDKATCGVNGEGCNFQVVPYQQGQAVVSQIAYDPMNHSCAKAKGGNPVYLYDANGQFTGRLPGM